MKTKFYLTSIFILCLALNCAKKKESVPTVDKPVITTPSAPIENDTKRPVTYQELLKSDSITAIIKMQSDQMVASFLKDKTSISDSEVDGLVTNLSKLQHIASVTSNSSRSSITLIKKDSTAFSYIIKAIDNAKLNKPIKAFNNGDNKQRVNYLPQGFASKKLGATFPLNRRALILAPFESQFHQDVNVIKGLLESCGYTVKVLKNNEVTVGCFKGDFLADYGVVYIKTHGATGMNIPIFGGDTELSTGQLYNSRSYFEEQYKGQIGNTTPGTDGKEYFSVTSSFIKKTLTKKFPNSLIYVDACESYYKNDLSNLFLENGAAAYIGFNDAMRVYFNNMVAVQLFSIWTNGNIVTPEHKQFILSTEAGSGANSSNIVINLANRGFGLFDADVFIRDQEKDMIGWISMENFRRPVEGEKGTILLSSWLNERDPSCEDVYPNNCWWHNGVSSVTVELNFKQKIPIFSKNNCNQSPNNCWWECDWNIPSTGSAVPYTDCYSFKTYDKSGAVFQFGSKAYTVWK